MAAFLPRHEGCLPYFLLLPAFLAAIHTVVCYVGSPTASLKQFSGPTAPPPDGLLARVYGVKNFYTSLVRFYAAYNISNPQVYDLAILTFVGTLFLYSGEVFVYKTSRVREMWFTFVLAGSSLVWMVKQREWYLSEV
ncbi:ergosterol biosynthesis protein-like protein Erg28 [Xylariaceae sp. AK1471]|nr:ergosterol biosynthesis protein-like protein Erg28 [Xylariaceae sp. AK1471]